ncbi:uncharacterized protein AB675_5147 [Cyphellophora attinorum]|uniref:Uncharacterized protein n=1 Tax=Cyphellophora attinorum TaxID=1664694 RepID=A0A0N0NLR9_9EURO|nr:uncharacterized protein AB675_5147 [Phialophora attinorum]KPI39498.1 hypothetical protein AB675_5147 [Phialophora attinorum]
MAPALLSKALSHAVVGSDSDLAVTRALHALSQTRLTGSEETTAQLSTIADAPLPVSVLAASAPSSLVSPVASFQPTAFQHNELDRTLADVLVRLASNPTGMTVDFSNRDEEASATHFQAHTVTYNIPRVSLERLLSSDQPNSFVAVSSGEALTITPDWTTGKHHEWHMGRHVWRRMPVVGVVVGVVLLWTVITWIGRRKRRVRVRQMGTEVGEKTTLAVE